MRTTEAVALMLILAGCAGAPEAEEAPRVVATTPAESPADALARRVFEASGGEALDEVAQLDFTFKVDRGTGEVMSVVHRWDRQSGRARVEWTDEADRLIVAVVDLDDRSGWATRDGAPVTGVAKAELLEAAYGRWINDAYWLAMPLKVLDPGVRRTKEPQRQRGGATFDILKLAFDGVGLTPGDQYWLWIDPQTGLVRYWDMLLQGRQDAPPITVSWEDYRPAGPLVLAREHRASEGPLRIFFTDVAAAERVRASDFVK